MPLPGPPGAENGADRSIGLINEIPAPAAPRP